MSEAAISSINGDPLNEGQAFPDPDTGQLFAVPRVKVLTDSSDPTVLKLAFSGSWELDREDPAQVKAYNLLRHGREATLNIDVLVVGASKKHHRDSEGDVDDIVESKALVVNHVHLELAEGDE